jgi:prefoldin subunit 4
LSYHFSSLIMRLCRCHHCRRYLFGECFFELSKDSTDEMLEKQKSEVQEQIDSHKAELLTIRETLADLKGKLYGRFGKNINLEE